jgi:hypothetical protein
MKALLPFIFCLLTLDLGAQYALHERRTELTQLMDSLRNSKTDDEKIAAHESFRARLAATLNDPSTFTYDFSFLPTLGVIDSPDGAVRIFTWNVELADASQVYGGFILHKNERRPEEHEVIELVDNSYMVEHRTEESLDASSWYGALYYKVIPVKKGSKTYYTVLGWDGNTNLSNIKLIDVIYFTANTAKLGYPLFKNGSETKKRIYMEHNEQAVMSLRWDEDQQQIIFDHLSPETSVLEGFYQYYVPDLTYDAYRFDDNKWTLVEDVIGVNKASGGVKVARFDPETGEDAQVKEAKNEWIDPTSSSPAVKEVHIAVLPDASAKDKKPEKAEKTKPSNALEAYESKKHKKEKSVGSSFSKGKNSTKSRKK